MAEHGRLDAVGDRHAGALLLGVRQETREFGARLALGASPMSIVVIVVRRAVLLVAGGAAAETVVAVAVAATLKSALFGIQPMDPAIVAGAWAMLLVANVLGAIIPAAIAARIAPMQALRD